MRRQDREIAEREGIDEILTANSVCHLAMVDDGRPYVVPMTYGYDGRCIYLHSATAGRKVEALRRDGRVCFSIFDGFHPPGADLACRKSTKYRSVIGTGTVTFLEGEDKVAALDMLMRQVYGVGRQDFPPQKLENVLALRIDIDTLTGKCSR